MTLNSATANREGADDRDDSTARRTATVRYRVTVYATVDLDTGAVTEVFTDDESVRPDGPTRDIVTPGGIEAEWNAEPVALTTSDKARAFSIAESAEWPTWTR